MSTTLSLETICGEINQMAVPARIRAVELILHSIDGSVTEKPEKPQKRGRLSELKGIDKGTWEGIDIDKFIREERDAWDSWIISK